MRALQFAGMSDITRWIVQNAAAQEIPLPGFVLRSKQRAADRDGVIPEPLFHGPGGDFI